jgi:hypothetical protein
MEWTVALANMNVPDSARAVPVRAAQKPQQETKETTQDTLLDLRFRALMSDAEWSSLPPAVRRRFTKRLAGGNTAVYAGEILETRMNLAGRCLAQLARIVGAPLPTSTDAHLPMIVSVTEDIATGGQIWTRLCTRRDGFPQIINSSKRFSGPTGIEEYLGRGLSMALTIHAWNGALVFRSDSYFLRVVGWRFKLPAFLSPGVMTVTHAEIGEGRFVFTLKVEHPWFGVLIDQTAAFQETTT